MFGLSKALIGLSATALVLAVITNFTGNFLTTSEGYSRASANLALIAIALELSARGRRNAPPW